jgi:hypothetical protein
LLESADIDHRRGSAAPLPEVANDYAISEFRAKSGAVL